MKNTKWTHTPHKCAPSGTRGSVDLSTSVYLVAKILKNIMIRSWPFHDNHDKNTINMLKESGLLIGKLRGSKNEN